MTLKDGAIKENFSDVERDVLRDIVVVTVGVTMVVSCAMLWLVGALRGPFALLGTAIALAAISIGFKSAFETVKEEIEQEQSDSTKNDGSKSLDRFLDPPGV